MAVGEPFDAWVHFHDVGLAVAAAAAGGPDAVPGFAVALGLAPDGTPADTDPDAFTWVAASADPDPPPGAIALGYRYGAALAVSAPGAWDVAARVTLDGGATWTVCDLDGAANGYAPGLAGLVYAN